LQDPALVEIANKVFGESRLKNVLVVLNRIGDEDTEDFLRTSLDHPGVTPIGMVHEDPAVASSWLKGVPIETAPLKADIEPIVAELERVIGAGIASTPKPPQKSLTALCGRSD
jgi:CO dehydrogenase nickel-insertion accessory protein CooC1